MVQSNNEVVLTFDFSMKSKPKTRPAARHKRSPGKRSAVGLRSTNCPLLAPVSTFQLGAIILLRVLL